jgi:hypothetical protein
VVFWVDARQGIAFVVAYYPQEKRHYLYTIIVFRPNTNLCPEEEGVYSPNWREVASYSLEGPENSARRRICLKETGLNSMIPA